MKAPKKPKPPARGRPKGTGSGRTTKDYKLTLPLDVAAWLDKQKNKSAAVAQALRAYLNLSDS